MLNFDSSLTLSSITGLGFLNVTDGQSSTTSNDASVNITILNCPFETYPRKPNFKCVPVSKLKAADDSIDASDLRAFSTDISSRQKRQTFFLNFGFSLGASINSLRFKWPTVSAISQPSEVVQCHTELNHEKRCSHSLTLEKDANITLVLLNLGNGSAVSHPIHVHGHTYKVLKMGFPTVLQNGTLVPNDDIECEKGKTNENSLCSNASWINKD